MALQDMPRSPSNAAAFLRLLEDSEEARARYEETGDLAQLRRAAALALRASRRAPDDHGTAAALANYASHLQWLLHLTGRGAWLSVVERRYRQAYVLFAPDAEERLLILSNLLVLARQRYERTGEVRHLDAGIELARNALAERQPGVDQRKVMIQQHLGSLLRFRFRASASVGDLEESIALIEEAHRDNTDPRHAAGIANSLAAVLGEHFSYTGHDESLLRSVELLEATVDLLAPGDPDRAMLANNLANGLCERYELLGDTRDLEAAIDRARLAVRVGEGGEDETRYRRTLGGYLVQGFRSTGRLELLRSAVDELRAAHRLAPEGSESQPLALATLATALRTLSITTGDQVLEDEYIEASRAAVAATSPESAAYPARLSNLCMHLSDLALRRADRGLMDDAIRRHRALLDALPGEHRWRSDLTYGYASLLTNRSRLTGAREDAHEAMEHCRAVIASAATGSPLNVQARVGLARAATQAHHLSGTPANSAVHRRAWLEAVEAARLAGPRLAFDTAVQCLRHAADERDWPLGTTAAEVAVAGLEELVLVQHTTSERHEWIRFATDLSSLAVESAMGTDAPLVAVELAHRAHGMVLRLTTGSRTAGPGTTWWQDMRAAATGEPVVLLAPGRWSGHALVVDGELKVRSVRLPGLTVEDAGAWADRHAEVADSAAGLRDDAQTHRFLLDLGLWLGRNVMQPLLEELDTEAFAAIDLGRLGGLPLAAAWWLDPDRRRPVALHEAVRVRTLPGADTGYRPDTAPRIPGPPVAATVVGTGAHPGDQLISTEARLLAACTRLTELPLDEPDRWSLPRAAELLHITGHAAVDGSVVDGGRITVPGGERISFRDLAGPLTRLAAGLPPVVLLTACRTVHRDARVPGEHVGLASIALHLRARAVIGTTMRVPDRSMFVFTARFLKVWCAGAAPVHAWHQAVGWVADTPADEIVAFLTALAHELGEPDAALTDLLTWLSGRPRHTPPFASPLYWAPITYVGR
ncbi:CHAT domain-containing protein [Streptomyces sp. NPDC102405]|uniref:CHAT domain-containing protein n=1 Tax=Streptomyces sp. NPDC102405 TaxID=3366170 RepID=UPI0037FF5A17